MIRVEKDAQKTDAYQKNDSLILSDEARADSIPGLENRGQRRPLHPRRDGGTGR